MMDGSASDSDQRYQSALNYLYGRINYERTAAGVPGGSRLNLDRMRELLHRLGDPQESLKAIHIAGTKGKGSTAAMIAASLTAADYRTGLYTSPHLERLEERIAIDGCDCSPNELVELVELVRPAVSKLDELAATDTSLGAPTFFEITTAMAFLHFARQSVDVVVLEVGLGGRLDSTNVCQPIISVITSISFDHTKQLGNTLAAIAREKGGVIKPSVPVVCGVDEAEAMNEIHQIADEIDVPLLQQGRDFSYEYSAPVNDFPNCIGGTIAFHQRHGATTVNFANVSVGMLGEHQAKNAAIAIAALLLLKREGWNLSEDAIRQGIRDARIKARIEVVSRNPIVILDTAHNVASIDALLSVLHESFANRSRTLIFAATRDKDVSGMLRHVLPQFESIILTRYVDNPRGVSPQRLVELVNKLRDDIAKMPDVKVCDSPAVAWEVCKSRISPEDIVCVTGSFFLAAEMRSLVAMPD